MNNVLYISDDAEKKNILTRIKPLLAESGKFFISDAKDKIYAKNKDGSLKTKDGQPKELNLATTMIWQHFLHDKITKFVANFKKIKIIVEGEQILLKQRFMISPEREENMIKEVGFKIDKSGDAYTGANRYYVLSDNLVGYSDAMNILKNQQLISKLFERSRYSTEYLRPKANIVDIIENELTEHSMKEKILQLLGLADNAAPHDISDKFIYKKTLFLFNLRRMASMSAAASVVYFIFKFFIF